MAYYREPEGKVKKKALNARRRSGGRARAEPAPADPAPLWLGPIVAYVCVMVGLIEGRPVQRSEVIAMLERTRRQHRMVRTRRIDQGVAWLHERPP